MTAVNDSHVVYASDTMGNQNRRPPPNRWAEPIHRAAVRDIQDVVSR
jgi:hypothetical protein